MYFHKTWAYLNVLLLANKLNIKKLVIFNQLIKTNH